MPERVQRRRTRGWRMPADTLYVGRPGKWGNPFRVGSQVGPVHDELTIVDEGRAVAAYARWLDGWRPTVDGVKLPAFDLDLEELRGHNLACYCGPEQPCHVDVLLDRANRPVSLYDLVVDEDDMCEGHPNDLGDLVDCGLPVGHGGVPELVEPTGSDLPPRGPRYSQLTIPGTPSRPRPKGSTVRAHCTSCGRYAANPRRDTDTGFCVVHGACHLTWG